MFSWGISFLGRTRGQMAITSQMMYARPVAQWVEQQAEQGTLAAVERAEAEQKAAG
jgi:NADH dehydrogenase